MTHRVALSQTSASEIDLDTLPSGVTYVKIDDLVEVPFEIVDARIVPSNFDEKKLCAQVQFHYLNEQNQNLDNDEEDTIYQFSSEQRAIKAQVQAWNNEGIAWGEVTVGPVTITIYGARNSYGRYPMCIAEIVPEIAAPEPPKRGTPSQAVHRDMGTDTQRQQLAGKSAIDTQRSLRPGRPVSH